jgi:hypothetical protein
MLLFKEIIKDGFNSGQAPARTKNAREWFRNAASQVVDIDRRVKPGNIVRNFEEKRKVTRLDPGQMYMFRYDPKNKKKLPYYDTFPLIFPIDIDNDSFMGINLHYLPPISRGKLMNALYTVTSDKRFDDNTRVLATYKLMASASKFKLFKPTVKRYLFQHVRSPFLEITAREWDIALFLPTEQFKKVDKVSVWAESLLQVK